jgi:hypothetical protein
MPSLLKLDPNGGAAQYLDLKIDGEFYTDSGSGFPVVTALAKRSSPDRLAAVTSKIGLS